MATPEIEPMSHGTLIITVKNPKTKVPYTDAVVTATIYLPSGKVVTGASDLACPHDADGEYTLTVLPAWSTDAQGRPIVGVFKARVKTVRNARQRVREFPYTVTFKTRD